MPQSTNIDESWVYPPLSSISHPQTKVPCKIRVVVALTGPRPVRGYHPHLAFQVTLNEASRAGERVVIWRWQGRLMPCPVLPNTHCSNFALNARLGHTLNLSKSHACWQSRDPSFLWAYFGHNYLFGVR
jgi:hypothetical protein